MTRARATGTRSVSKYFYYTNLRVPVVHGMACDGTYDGVLGSLRLADFTRISDVSTKRFVIKVFPSSGGYLPVSRGGFGGDRGRPSSARTDGRGGLLRAAVQARSS